MGTLKTESNPKLKYASFRPPSLLHMKLVRISTIDGATFTVSIRSYMCIRDTLPLAARHPLP